MTRVKRGTVARKRRQKILNFNKGYRAAASVLFRTANQRFMKALKSAYQNRRRKKRDFRSLWISRLNATLRLHGITYHEFIHILKTSEIVYNRQILSQFSLFDIETFQKFFKMLLQIRIQKLSL
uniref:ribosomal protein L20 n=1 Tax=Hydrocytium acuminatum TaxID=1745963 RepID=UPI002A7FD324|nr:ribosomal protein L20 [Hydrocytium acuminatum]WOR09544.1 ribosomal protein L20 [Hydrocytium acuminatum]